MKSFLGFLKEHATLVYEDTALKYQTQNKNEEVVSFDPHVKQGYYLYFVEYQSLSQKDIENVYFGIKHSPGQAGDPSNFWASLRWTGTDYHALHRDIWEKNLLMCQNGQCERPKKSDMYMSSSSGEANYKETLTETYLYGLTKDDSYHPWILNYYTYDRIREYAEKKKVRFKPDLMKAFEHQGEIPSKGDYAYRIYVIEDMRKLNDALKTAANDKSSKMPKEVKDFYNEYANKVDLIENDLVENFMKWYTEGGKTGRKKAYYTYIQKFYELYPDEERPKEFDTEETYLAFLRENIKKHSFALIGTFENIASQFMKDLITGEKMTNPYEHLKKKLFQTVSTESVIAMHDTNKNLTPAAAMIFFPADMSDVLKHKISDFMKGKDPNFSQKKLQAIREKERQETERLAKVAKRKDMMFDKWTLNRIKGRSPNLDVLLTVIRNKYKGVDKEIEMLKKYFIQKELPLLFELVPNESIYSLYLSVDAETNKNHYDILMRPEGPMTKKASLNNDKKTARVEVQNRIDHVYDYDFQVMARDTFWFNQYNLQAFLQDIFGIHVYGGATVVEMAYELKSENLLESLEKKDIAKASMNYFENVLRQEKTPFGKIFFQYNEKDTLSVSNSTLKEDVDDDKRMDVFKKLIISAVQMGIVHDNLHHKEK